MNRCPDDPSTKASVSTEDASPQPDLKRQRERERDRQRYRNDPRVRKRQVDDRKERYHSDPAFRRKDLEQSKAWYVANRERVLEEQRRRRREDPAWAEKDRRRKREQMRVARLMEKGETIGFAYEVRPKMPKRQNNWAAIPQHKRDAFRKIVFERDGFVCQIQADGCTGVAEELDHIVPRSVDPSRLLDPTNARSSCRNCNRTRPKNNESTASRAW